MKITLIRVAALAALVSLLALPATADETSAPSGPHAALIKAKSGTVVAMKFVLKMEMSFGGNTQNHEVNGSATGVMIDDSGLVMTNGSNFDPRLGLNRRMRAQVKITAVPVNLRVIFPGEEKEYPAILGAKDSKFGLAFVLIKDLGDKKVESLDLTQSAGPEIGGALYGVTRLDQGFDYAPICSRVRVIGQVTKPRPMWVLGGGNSFLGMPLYTRAGGVAGICVQQSGVGAEAQARIFALPLKIASATVRMARKESARALEEVLEAEAEAAEEKAAEEKADAEGEGGDKPKGDGEKKDGDGKSEGDGMGG